MTNSKPEASASREGWRYSLVSRRWLSPGMEYKSHADVQVHLNALQADLARERERADRAELDHSLLVDDYKQLLISLGRAREQTQLWRQQVEEANIALKAERVLREAAERELARCGRENCMGLEVDGVASWVRKERLETAEAALAALQAKYDDMVLYLADWRHRALAAEALALGSPQTEAPEPRGTSA